MNIDNYRKKLEQQQQILEARLERTAKHLYRRDEPYSADFAEQVVEVENNEVVEQLDGEAKIELASIQQALMRIKNGRYGTCQQCSKPINNERLEAIPHVTHCIDCASTQ
jgi:RNA polymerase-binding protein DksA